MNEYHIPVMLQEVLDFLKIQQGSWYIDCNLGGGGHTEGILSKGGKVVGIDLDTDAITHVSRRHSIALEKKEGHLVGVSDNLILYQSNFSEIDTVVKKIGIKDIQGVLFDLGVSSFQLETAERGFSFNADAPLDMRMDQSLSVTAADLINGLHEKELSELFWKLGEENYARVIAKRIVESRQKGKIETTDQLARVILSVRKRSDVDRTHPATRVFQALRIAVNDELNSLKVALPRALEILSPRGRLVVISFHSLEDRIVKNFLKEGKDQGELKIVTDKPLTPAQEEKVINPRSRSGKLRVGEKI